MSGARQARGPATLLAAALVAAVSLSGAVRQAAPPIDVAIPGPFSASAPGEDPPTVPTRRWLRESTPLGAAAPSWARRLYSRSLLVLRNLTDARTGAQIAADREGWAYVWPRDAAIGALALAAAGHRPDARRIAGFLTRLDLDAAARFEPGGDPLPGRPAAGDARGWVNAAARTVGIPAVDAGDWREHQDYGENIDGDLLGNAIAGGASSAEILDRFGAPGGLGRTEGGGGLDSAAAWAVMPFPRSGLRSSARRTLIALTRASGRFGIPPTTDWTEGEAWTAPTAWSAWALARLGKRRAADRLLTGLHGAETAAGTLPERVSATDGRPLSVTPLAWSHAFAVLALLERYPGRR
ncbi:MAG: hypothetical protein ACXWEF_02480 [Solirubrobacterales bacterium]